MENPIVKKVAWMPVQERRVLFARSRGQKLFYCVGGKPEGHETNLEALVRECEEEVGVSLVPESIEHLHTFIGPCHGYPEGTELHMACYDAEYLGHLKPLAEVEELAWFTTADIPRTTPMGKTILDWFKERDLID